MHWSAGNSVQKRRRGQGEEIETYMYFIDDARDDCSMSGYHLVLSACFSLFVSYNRT